MFTVYCAWKLRQHGWGGELRARDREAGLEEIKEAAYDEAERAEDEGLSVEKWIETHPFQPHHNGVMF